MKFEQVPNAYSEDVTRKDFDKPDFLEVEVVGGVNVDFSAGLFISTLTDDRFGIDPDDGTIERRGEEDSFSTAVGSLVHVYTQRHRKAHWAGSFGLGLDGRQDLQVLLGLSVILGIERRWIATVGVAGGKVERLGGGLERGDTLPSGLTSVPTERRTRVGAFVGFTFNFGAGSTPPAGS